jgi:hypothetical protein
VTFDGERVVDIQCIGVAPGFTSLGWRIEDVKNDLKKVCQDPLVWDHMASECDLRGYVFCKADLLTPAGKVVQHDVHGIKFGNLYVVYYRRTPVFPHDTFETRAGAVRAQKK